MPNLAQIVEQSNFDPLRGGGEKTIEMKRRRMRDNNRILWPENLYK